MKGQEFTVGAASARDLAFAWLEQQTSLLEPSSPHGVARALDWLIAVWLYERGFGPGPVPLSSKVAGIIARHLDGGDSRQAFGSLLKCDPLRAVLAYAILKRCDVACAILDAFLNGLTESLVGSIEETGPDDIDLLETRLILSLRGLAPAPLPTAPRECDFASMLALIQADEPMIQGIAKRVAIASA